MTVFALLLVIIAFCVHEYSLTTINLEAKDNSALRRRLKRNGAFEEPLQVSQKQVYLQAGHSYLLPCTVIQIGEAVDAIFWFKGKSLEAIKRELIIRQVYPDDSQNYVTDPRYQISASHGIIIAAVNSTDTDRYWCKTVRNGRFVEDYLDATVLDKLFPADSDSIVDETSVSLSAEIENTIYCPLILQASTDITFYWSIFTGNVQPLDIIFAKFADGATMSVQKYSETHSPEGKKGLNIEHLKSREDQYCCHVFKKGSDLRTACINVTWLGLEETTSMRTVTNTYSCPDSISASLGVTLFLLIVLVVFLLLVCLMLICPKSQKYILNHVSGIPTLPCYPQQCALRTRNPTVMEVDACLLREDTELQETAPLETAEDSTKIVAEGDTEVQEATPLTTAEDAVESVGDRKEDKVCLQDRGCEKVDITDLHFVWDYLGQLLTESAREEKSLTGFQAIKDVLSIQDGGLVVIDSKGLHLFTADYHDRFVDMYGALGEKSYRCVAYFMKDKLLFGLEWGKLVIFDIENEQVHTLACITPVRDQIVQLGGLAVNRGFVLASDRTGKTVTAFDQNGVCLKRFNTPSIEPGFLTLHEHKKELIFFVTSQDVVRKYQIKGEKGQSKLTHSFEFDISKESLGKKSEEFKPGRTSVKKGCLLVETPLKANKYQILGLSVSSGVFERSIIVEAPDIRGTKFINEDRLVLYSGDSVYVFKTKQCKNNDSSACRTVAFVQLTKPPQM